MTPYVVYNEEVFRFCFRTTIFTEYRLWNMYKVTRREFLCQVAMSCQPGTCMV